MAIKEKDCRDSRSLRLNVDNRNALVEHERLRANKCNTNEDNK